MGTENVANNNKYRLLLTLWLWGFD